MPDTPAPADARQSSRRNAVRPVHRAMAALRKGEAVRLTSNGESLVVAAIETSGPVGVGAVLVSRHRAAFLVPGLHAGDSAEAVAFAPADWATLRAWADPVLPVPDATPSPIPAPPGAEAALTLAKLARLLPALVVTGTAPSAEVEAADIASYPAGAARALERVAEAPVPLEDAPDARIVAFRVGEDGREHLAVLIGRPEQLAGSGEAPLVRVHSECFTGDLLGSLRCDCGAQLRGAVRRMAEAGAGAILYMAQEGRGIGLPNKLRAYALQDRGLDTLDANRALGFLPDERSFLLAAQMLDQLGIRRIRLLTNNPDKLAALSACGIEITGRESLLYAANGVNDRYLETKARRFGHLLG